jgi:hypothetical protein
MDLGESNRKWCHHCFKKHIIPKVKERSKSEGWCDRVTGHMIDLAWRRANQRTSIEIGKMILEAIEHRDGGIRGGGFWHRDSDGELSESSSTGYQSIAIRALEDGAYGGR